MIRQTILLLALLTLITAGAASAAQPRPAAGVAVVELFTSQGCSSCPPAERLIADLNTAAAHDSRPVFTLAFHVDYWDRLGWRDPFSDAAFSARQSDYGRAMQLSQIYTPQMIVNGRAQFVGSDREQASAAIATAVATPAAVPMTVHVTRDSAGSGYHLHYSAPAAASGQMLNVAVVEQGLSTSVKSGENGGSTLDQPSVVRAFKTLAAATSGDVSVTIPSGVQADRSSIVAYIQQANNGAVLGAGASQLP